MAIRKAILNLEEELRAQRPCVSASISGICKNHQIKVFSMTILKCRLSIKWKKKEVEGWIEKGERYKRGKNIEGKKPILAPN